MIENTEEWFTLDDIRLSDSEDTLYCISVDAPDKQFLAGYSGIPTHNTDEGKEEDGLKGEAAMIIGSIARLGRAAGVHLILATQRPDAKVLAGETKANLGVRINCGRTDPTASSMILGNGEGARVKSNPRGRLYLRIYGSGDHGQGFLAQPEWIDEYLQSQGLNPDGTPIGSKKQSKLANITDMSTFAEGDLDSREGIDNSKIIEQIREEETSKDFSDIMSEEDYPIQDNDPYEDLEEGFDEDEFVPYINPNEERPELNSGSEDPSERFARAEDDWSSELEDLIMENFDEGER